MTNDLSPVANGVADLPSVLVSNDVESARRYVDASTAASTRRAYESDWAIYRTWCIDRGYEPVPSPPEQVALFLAHEADRHMAVSTVERRLAAIGFFHRAQRYPAPTAMEGAGVIQTTMRGIRRQIGAARRKKRPATDDLVRRMLDAIPETGLRNLRDRAVLAFGLASAMRRSELVAVEVGHLTRTDDGVEILIPRSKTDQDGAGHTIAIPRGLRLRPLAALDAWLRAADIHEGAIFRSLRRGGKVLERALTGESVALILKERAAAVGLDPRDFAAHSLRSGFLTSAAKSGASIFKMKDQSRHESLDVLAGYVRDADRFRDHAGAGFL